MSEGANTEEDVEVERSGVAREDTEISGPTSSIGPIGFLLCKR